MGPEVSIEQFIRRAAECLLTEHFKTKFIPNHTEENRKITDDLHSLESRGVSQMARILLITDNQVLSCVEYHPHCPEEITIL